MRRSPPLALITWIACLITTSALAAGEAWILQSHDEQTGRTCSLSTTDRGRALSVSVSLDTPAMDQGIVGITFDGPEVVQAGAKTLVTIEFDNGTRGDHRLEALADGSSLIPIVAADMQDVLRAFSESRKLRIATRFGSTSFSLDGIADYIPDLRRCAGS